MNRQQALSISCGLCSMPTAVPAVAQKVRSTGKERPNIVFILADDLGIGDIQPYGQRIIRTPNLERMAHDGLTFTQAYAGTAVSAPSRASLLTGFHTGHTFIRGNLRHDPEGQVAMPEGTYTLAQMLHDAGYATGCFGKWGLGYPGSTSDPTRVGFDNFFGYNCQTLAHDYYPDHLWDNLKSVDLPMNANQQENVYSADTIHARALQFIRQHAHEPFFAFLSYTLPHAELRLPEDSVFSYYASIIPDSCEKPFAEANPNRRGAYGSQRRPLAAFAAMVTRLDRYVGDVMRVLKEEGIADNTLVIFTSDNGPHREGGANPDYFDSYAQYRGVKRDLYEGGIRMPMLAVWPHHIAAGTTSDRLVAFWDMMPTFASLAGAKCNKHTDGLSFSSLLDGGKPSKVHDHLYWEFHEQGGKQAVRWGKWKLVKLQVSHPERTVTELYDLTTDIHEDHNVAAEHPDVVKHMEKIIGKEHRDSELFDFRKGK